MCSEGQSGLSLLVYKSGSPELLLSSLTYVNDRSEPLVRDQARAWACPALRVSVRLANRNDNLLITCLKGTRLSDLHGRQASPHTCYLTSLAVYLRCQVFPRIPPGDPHTATTQVETV